MQHREAGRADASGCLEAGCLTPLLACCAFRPPGLMSLCYLWNYTTAYYRAGRHPAWWLLCLEASLPGGKQVSQRRQGRLMSLLPRELHYSSGRPSSRFEAATIAHPSNEDSFRRQLSSSS